MLWAGRCGYELQVVVALGEHQKNTHPPVEGYLEDQNPGGREGMLLEFETISLCFDSCGGGVFQPFKSSSQVNNLHGCLINAASMKP